MNNIFYSYSFYKRVTLKSEARKHRYYNELKAWAGFSTHYLSDEESYKMVKPLRYYAVGRFVAPLQTIIEFKGSSKISGHSHRMEYPEICEDGCNYGRLEYLAKITIINEERKNKKSWLLKILEVILHKKC